MSDCRMCIERGKPENFGSDPTCSFPEGVFNSDGWRCATMDKLRELAENGHASERNMDEACFGKSQVSPRPYFGTAIRSGDSSFAFIECPIFDDVGYHLVTEWIVMGWYKSRGRVGVAMLLNDESASPLTLEAAERAIKAHTALETHAAQTT